MHVPCTILRLIVQILLHISASRRIYTGQRIPTSMESNGRHACSPLGPGHNPSVMFSNVEDQTRSQHKHLQYLGNYKNAIVNSTPRGQ
jgi:hypothetical protein